MKLNKTIESLLDSWDMASFELALALLGCGSMIELENANHLHDWASKKEKNYCIGYAYRTSFPEKGCCYLSKHELNPSLSHKQRMLQKVYF